MNGATSTASLKTYRDPSECPAGHSFVVNRRVATAGKKVTTICPDCRRHYDMKAGSLTGEVVDMRNEFERAKSAWHRIEKAHAKSLAKGGNGMLAAVDAAAVAFINAQDDMKADASGAAKGGKCHG